MLTARDIEWLEWLGMWRCATAPMMAAHFLPTALGGVQTVERRMRTWREMEAICSERVFHDMRSVMWLAPAGARLVGAEGSVKRPPIGQMRHDLAVVEAATWIQARSNVDVLTERQVRVRDLPGDQSPSVAIRSLAVARKVHYADFWTVSEARGMVAHEVDQTPKNKDRLFNLMLNYGSAAHLSGAWWWVPEKLLSRTLEVAEKANKAIAARHQVNHFVTVKSWVWENG